MKALTLWRPWPWAIFRAGKPLENRTWLPPESMIGERIAIHAGKQWDSEGASWIIDMLLVSNLARWDEIAASHGAGCIIGTVVIGGIGGASNGLWVIRRRGNWTGDKTAGWWAVGPYCWLLCDPVELPEPIPCRGARRLWEVPADVEAEIEMMMNKENRS